MGDGARVFLLGLVLGALGFAMLIMVFPAGKIYEYDIAIELCQLELPRNQKCEITARIKQEK